MHQLGVVEEEAQLASNFFNREAREVEDLLAGTIEDLCCLCLLPLHLMDRC